MKKALLSFLTAFIFAAGTTLAQGNNQSSAEPPARVKVNFNARYPDNAGSTKWQQNGEGYTASFKQNGQATESEFTGEGRWVKSTTMVQENKLPADALKYIKESYPDYTYQKGLKYENAKGARYEVDIRSENKDYRLLFDKSGGFTDEKAL